MNQLSLTPRSIAEAHVSLSAMLLSFDICTRYNYKDTRSVG